MNDKRDQVQAHMFIMGRLTSGMLRADPDAPESPQGRTNRGIAISVLIAVLICAGAFVFGLFKPGTKSSWRDPGTLVVNKDSGARYLFLGGRLRPVRNFTSAKLLAGDQLKVMSVGGESLKDTPHGAPVGIPGAPEKPPGTGELDDGPWQVCSGSTDGSTGTTVAVGAEPDGTALEKGQGLLVRGPDKAGYLVWQGRKLRLDAKANAPEALGYGSDKPLAVSAALLNSLPSGPDLSPPEVSDMGAAGPELGGRQTRIGQVFKVTAAGAKARYYQLHKEGLAPLSATGAALVLGDPVSKDKAYGGGSATARPLGTDALDGRLADDSRVPGPDEDLPSTPPSAVDLPRDTTLCAGVRSAGGGLRISVTLADPGDLGPSTQPPTEGLTPACVTVNKITVRPGGGAVVHALGAGGSDVGSTLYLVTDTGMKYRLSSKDTLKALGYTETPAQGVPSSLLSMLPTGPDLTPKAASSGRANSSAPECENARDSEGSAPDPDKSKKPTDSASSEARTVRSIDVKPHVNSHKAVLREKLTHF
ncbi:type VII secretion protein EccB [Streptomyces sp. NPDC007025]|uniref:type VII secretion protein EccB n=1 Tax=Streptomyces sp. NPDC007025 TaxID=3364771 RepID=UPI0036BF5D67